MANTQTDMVLSNLFTFESLVQFPLASIIDSSASANKTTLDFLIRYCFEEEDGKRVAKTFIFYYEYVKGGAAKTMKVEIPIISLITMPYYTIESAHFEMGVNIISWFNKQVPGDNNADEDPRKLLAMLGPYDAKTTKAPTPSPESPEYSKVSTNMKVRMEVVSSDLPAGILQLINVSSQGVEGNIANDLRISVTPSRLFMNHSEASLTLKLVRNVYDIKTLEQEHELALVPLTITLQSSVSDVNPEREFSKEITVTKGDIVGTASRDQVQVLTDSDGEVEIMLHPSDKISTNGFVTISSPVTSSTKIYYRIDNA